MIRLDLNVETEVEVDIEVQESLLTQVGLLITRW